MVNAKKSKNLKCNDCEWDGISLLEMCLTLQLHFLKLGILKLGARLRGRTATQRSKKGSEKVLRGVLGKGSQKGSENGVCCGFYSKKGFSERVLTRGFPEGA